MWIDFPCIYGKYIYIIWYNYYVNIYYKYIHTHIYIYIWFSYLDLRFHLLYMYTFSCGIIKYLTLKPYIFGKCWCMYLEDTFALFFIRPARLRKIKLLVATEELSEVFLRRSQVKHLRTLKSYSVFHEPWESTQIDDPWPHDGSTVFRTVFLFTWISLMFDGKCIGKYTSPMNPYGFGCIPTVYDDKAA